MIVSLSYGHTAYGKLEKLEGNYATVRIYMENGSPQEVTLKLKDTMDRYLKQPLSAKGQGVFIYDNNTLSQVDKSMAIAIMSFLKFVWVLLFSVFFFLYVIDLSERKAVNPRILSLGFAIVVSIIFVIFRVLDPQRELVDYGRIIQYDAGACVIMNEDGDKQFYELADRVRDGSTKEGGIIKSCYGYVLYPSFNKSKNIIEATMQYVKERTSFQQKVLKYIVCAAWAIYIFLYAKQKHFNRQRAKIEEERLRQEALKQQEIIHNCEKYVNEFLQDFFDSPEETNVLLARLKLKLEKSGYKNWRKDFYADAERKAKAYQRPSRKQRQKYSKEKTDFGDLLIDFNGVFVTPIQYQILSKYSKTRNLSRAQVLELCRKLAETRPEFASFKEVRDIQPYVAKEENNEAFRLFGLTSETLTVESLKQAYRRLVQKYHPDRNKEPNAVEMFQKVQRYYAYLEGLARS